MKRNNQWLKDKFLWVWQNHFCDVQIINPIEIKFGQKSRTRFGSIRLRNREISRILINGYFKNLEVPEEVVMATIAHEAVHYVHGFSSLHPKIAKYPHRNGIVSKELFKRGLRDLYEFEKKWSKVNWPEFIMKNEMMRRQSRKIKLPMSRNRVNVGLAQKLIKLFLQIYP